MHTSQHSVAFLSVFTHPVGKRGHRHSEHSKLPTEQDWVMQIHLSDEVNQTPLTNNTGIKQIFWIENSMDLSDSCTASFRTSWWKPYTFLSWAMPPPMLQYWHFLFLPIKNGQYNKLLKFWHSFGMFVQLGKKIDRITLIDRSIALDLILCIFHGCLFRYTYIYLV